MKITQDQLDFIRRHGITRCPPTPIVPMYWGSRRHGRRQNGALAFAEASEADLLRGLAVYDWRWPANLRRPGLRVKS